MGNEYDGLSEQEKKSLQQYRDELAQSIDFVRPYFQDFVRFGKLYAGQRPPEIDGTFSKVMLWYPFSIIDAELPVTLRSMFSNPDWINLEAMEYEFEQHAKVATKWTRYQLEKLQRISQTIIPSAQSIHIFGTGYRYYEHKYIKKQKADTSGMLDMLQGIDKPAIDEEQGLITGSYMNIFNVYPAPFGGLVNAPDALSDAVAPYVIVMTWPTEDQIKAEGIKGNFNKGQIAKMLESKGNQSDPASDFKDELSNMESGWGSFSKPAWIQKALGRGLKVDRRRRVAWRMSSTNWKAVAEDKFLLYDGPPLLDAIPLAKGTGSYDLDNWFGIGLIKPCEDLLISMIMNFNHRMDYLAGVFHPPTYIPQRLIDDCGGDPGIFDPEPYKTIAYNHKQFPGGMGQYIFHDRNDDIDQQAFVEEAKMQGYLQEIIGQYPVTTLDGNNATTTAALVSKDAARSMLRAINIENSILHDSAWLTLKLGAKYSEDDKWIRVADSDGFPWQQVDKEAITDKYGIMITGAKDLQIADITFRRMLSVAPLLLGNQQVRGQLEAVRQLASKGGFENIDTIIMGEKTAGPALPQGAQEMEAQAMGGVPSIGGGATMQNDMAGAQNNQSPISGTGMAGNILV